MELKKQIDTLLAKSLILANYINRNTEMCCFIDDVAHCGWLEFRLLENKKNYESPPIKKTIYYEIAGEFSKDSEDRKEQLEEWVLFLEETLKNKKIDFSGLYAETREIIDYYTI